MISNFAKLKLSFNVNWTTLLVGWQGLGVLSPWPQRWIEFPPLLSADEIQDYASERLASSSDSAEHNLIIRLLSIDPKTESREAVRDVLNRLSDLEGADPSLELRKWRVILLEQLIVDIPKDPVYGLLALTEFWQNFGFPADSPHQIQGRGNTISPIDYYQQENWERILHLHRDWIKGEREAIKKQLGAKAPERL